MGESSVVAAVVLVTALVLVQSPAWELPHAAGAAKKIKKPKNQQPQAFSGPEFCFLFFPRSSLG